jgi:hypothetical protein
VPGEHLDLVMRNVVPELGDSGFSGPYDAMRMTLERA